MFYVLVFSVVLNCLLAGMAWEFFKNSNCHIVKAENIELKAYIYRVKRELEMCQMNLDNAKVPEANKH